MVLGEYVDIHNDYAHEVFINPEAANTMTRYYRMHAEQVAQLAGMFDSLIDPLGDGVQTLLDNTMILWVGELGDAAHGFTGGRLWSWVEIRSPPFAMVNISIIPPISPSMQRAEPLSAWHNPIKTLHQHRAFGMDVNVIGESSLPADDGSTVDCTGPLEGLT